MSRSSNYLEKWADANRLQPRVSYTKGEVIEDEHDGLIRQVGHGHTSFHAELFGDGTVMISQKEDEVETYRVIKMDLQGAKKFAEWVWLIMKED